MYCMLPCSRLLNSTFGGVLASYGLEWKRGMQFAVDVIRQCVVWVTVSSACLSFVPYESCHAAQSNSLSRPLCAGVIAAMLVCFDLMIYYICLNRFTRLTSLCYYHHLAHYYYRPTSGQIVKSEQGEGSPVPFPSSPFLFPYPSLLSCLSLPFFAALPLEMGP